LAIDEKTLDELVYQEMSYYKQCPSYDYLNFLGHKYAYPVTGEKYHDMIHDHYNMLSKKDWIKDKPQPIHQQIAFRDFTYSIITWFYKVNDIYTSIDPDAN